MISFRKFLENQTDRLVYLFNELRDDRRVLGIIADYFEDMDLTNISNFLRDLDRANNFYQKYVILMNNYDNIVQIRNLNPNIDVLALIPEGNDKDYEVLIKNIFPYKINTINHWESNGATIFVVPTPDFYIYLVAYSGPAGNAIYSQTINSYDGHPDLTESQRQIIRSNIEKAFKPFNDFNERMTQFIQIVP